MFQPCESMSIVLASDGEEGQHIVARGTFVETVRVKGGGEEGMRGKEGGRESVYECVCVRGKERRRATHRRQWNLRKNSEGERERGGGGEREGGG